MIMTMQQSDGAVRRSNDPFTVQVGLTRDPIRRSFQGDRISSTRTAGLSTNLRRLRDRDVTYTSPRQAVRPRDGIQRRPLEPTVSLTSDFNQNELRQNGRRPVTNPMTDRHSRNSGPSNGGSTISNTLTQRSHSFGAARDFSPTWHHNESHQQVIHRISLCLMCKLNYNCMIGTR